MGDAAGSVAVGVHFLRVTDVSPVTSKGQLAPNFSASSSWTCDRR